MLRIEASGFASGPSSEFLESPSAEFTEIARQIIATGSRAGRAQTKVKTRPALPRSDSHCGHPGAVQHDRAPPQSAPSRRLRIATGGRTTNGVTNQAPAFEILFGVDELHLVSPLLV